MATPASPIVQHDPLPEEGDIVADDADSAIGSDYGTDTTSIKTAIHKGYMENGRRYARQKEYWGPSDQKQFEVMGTGHMVMCILDHNTPNALFRSPISKNAQNVLDIGTGQGDWAIDVADEFPSVTVRGVDLYPPPHQCVPPNCIFEVDDITKEWNWKEQFDLIHIRQLLAALTPDQINELYNTAYDNLLPGGWIEQVEFSIDVKSMNDAMPDDAILKGWHGMFVDVCDNAGFPIDIQKTMRGRMEAAGFTNVHEKEYKAPIGAWPKRRQYKDAGIMNKMSWVNGTEGWTMHFLTRYGLPKPWTPEEVRVWIAKLKAELEQPWNLYQGVRRVWAQKPYDTEKEEAAA